MSFTIKKGDYVAITGTSGCGKSTMLKLMMGIYQPQSGSVVVCLNDRTANTNIDCISNEVDNKKNPIQIGQMRRLFAYVPQGNFLMSGTIEDVITFGKRGRDDCSDADGKNRLVCVIQLACAEFIYDLPDRLATVLGERGAGLSEGQMQRIAIARALYADCPVLILDESTSALDQKTEQRLLHNLKELTDKTVLLVTHRSQALSICNEQLHFEDGRLTNTQTSEMQKEEKKYVDRK